MLRTEFFWTIIADHHEVRPAQIGVLEPLDVQVHEPQIPIAREHGGDGEQAQWRERGPLGNEAQYMFETPERIRRLRTDEENIHRKPGVVMGREIT